MDFVRAIPKLDTNGVPLAGGNTTFADGTVFVPAGNDARSSNWAWRPFGNDGVLSSLGPTTNTLPTNTKELVTTVTGLKPSGKYDLRVLFWTTDSGLWGVRGGLNYARGLRTNTWFDQNTSGVVEATLLPWRTAPSIVSESGRTLYAGSLGITNADSEGQLKAYIHDLPATDSNMRTWYQGLAVWEIVDPGPCAVDAQAAGTNINPGVRGLAMSDPQVNWGDYVVGIPMTLDVARGSSIRGVSTGLAAEKYDWRTRNGEPRPTTLQFLRYSRDYNAELFMGANIRGLIEQTGSSWRYYDTNISTLAALASDWARYVSRIVPTYRQGDSVNDTRDAAILNSLTWSSDTPGDSFDKLLAPGEQPVPQIKYWEIGNEPTVGVTAYSITNSFTLDPTNFYLRYGAVAKAIKLEDPNAKVGPTIINGTREQGQLAAIISDPTIPVDFIAYHPYERMEDYDDPASVTLYLGGVYSRQLAFYNGVKSVVAANGRDPESLDYAATEVNVSYWDINDTVKEAEVAHMLGSVETVFTHARLGLVASQYWIYPAHRYYGTQYPLFRAYEKLRDHMGDTLLANYAAGNTRVYTTRQSATGEIAVWALNFSNDEDATIDLQLMNLTKVDGATLLRLQDKSGKTTLRSANLAPDMTGGPSDNVDWVSQDVTGANFGQYQLQLAAATLSVLVIEPGISNIAPRLLDQEGATYFSVSFAPIPFASNVRYRLLRSSDLKTWEAVAECGAVSSGEVTLIDSVPVNQAGSRFFSVSVVR